MSCSPQPGNLCQCRFLVDGTSHGTGESSEVRLMESGTGSRALESDNGAKEREEKEGVAEKQEESKSNF